LSEWARRGQQQSLSSFDSSAERTTALQPQIRNGITLLPKRGVMVTSEQVYRLLDEEGA